MAGTQECPKCGAKMEYIEPEPDNGIEGGWECIDKKCGYAEAAEPYESDG